MKECKLFMNINRIISGFTGGGALSQSDVTVDLLK